MTDIILPLIIAYLFGSIPFGLLLTKYAGIGDIRSVGSGNIGATNVLRAGGKKLAIITLLLDALKGAAAVWVGHRLGAQFGAAIMTSLFAGIFAVIGHVFPVWLNFKGGKGLATALGALFMLNWQLGFIFVAVWVAVFAATRFSSLAGLTAMSIATLASIFAMSSREVMIFAVPVLLLLFYTHRANIQRLLNGTEHRFGRSAN